MIQIHAESIKEILGALQDLPANQNSQLNPFPQIMAELAVLVSWQILKSSKDFLHTFSMALYHKWDVKNSFAYVLQFFLLISDGLGGVLIVLASNKASGLPFLETSNSTRFSKFSISEGRFWISLSLSPSFRSFCRRKNGCKEKETNQSNCQYVLLCEVQFTYLGCKQFVNQRGRNIQSNKGISLPMEFLIDGQIFSFCPDHTESMLLILIMLHKLTQYL